MREVKLYGHLGKKFGKVFKLNVSSPVEALRALRANFSDFEAYMGRYMKQNFRVVVDGKDVDAQGLAVESKSSGTIKFIPVVSGKGRGFTQLIVGAIIVFAAIATNGMSLAAMSTAGTMAVSFGASLIIGGLTNMLTHAPSTKSVDNGASYAFNGAVNTTTQGNPVPICYGQMIVGSQVIFAGLSVEDNYVAPDNATTTGAAANTRPVVATPWNS